MNEGWDAQDIQDLLVQPDTDHEKSSSENLEKLRNYMKYATVKDLSIFLSFRQAADTTTNHNCPIMIFNNKVYYFSIKIIDLDPKHVDRISKYVRKKEEWLDACTQFWNSATPLKPVSK